MIQVLVLPSKSPLVESDPRTSTMVKRYQIVRAFMSDDVPKAPKDAEAMGETLYKKVKEDAYLEEVVASAEVCACLGRIKYIRDVLLPLQTSTEKVNSLGEHHKDMLSTLEQVSKSLTVEVNQVLADVTAEQKAAAEEEKTRLAEEKRLTRQKEKERQKEAKRLSKLENKKYAEAEKAAKEQAQALQDQQQDDCEEHVEEDAKPKGRRRTRVGAVGELSETDPMIFRASSKLPVHLHATSHTEVKEFFASIAGNLGEVHVCKARPATMKKVLQSVENISKTTATSYIKQINSDTGLGLNWIMKFWMTLMLSLVGEEACY